MNILSETTKGWPGKGKGSPYPGPVILISRECGCSAKRIATKLSKILTGYSYLSETKTDVEWKWVSKEVIEEAALELRKDPAQIRQVFQSEAKIDIREVANAFLTNKVYDADDQDVIDSVRKVIHRLAEEGNYIIVGRAASVIAADIPRKLSIKLQAPLECITDQANHNMSHAEPRYVITLTVSGFFIEHVAEEKSTQRF